MDLMTVKLALVVTGVLGVAVWQLCDVNRELRKHDDVDTITPLNISEHSPENSPENSSESRTAEQRPSQSGGG